MKRMEREELAVRVQLDVWEGRGGDKERAGNEELFPQNDANQEEEDEGENVPYVAAGRHRYRSSNTEQRPPSPSSADRRTKRFELVFSLLNTTDKSAI
ncbi:hypothetical protein MRB53_014629 [Persea americana]|uniref:Uncharacterized protein n=1 Tax=Persea americana TaxID=3435 RepID=A0ACC2KBE1_PERAE|nr:hypothetical protein MRB53_014629 [Persea americana]